jgi:signal peptidase I
MEPTLSEGDRLTTRSIDGKEVSRGDVVVLLAPAADGSGSMLIVKRVIAVAGDEIEATGGEVLINGEAADEPYLGPGTSTAEQ